MNRKVSIQPLLQTFEESVAYANEMDFDLEIVDFAFPSVINGTGSEALNEYKEKLTNNSKWLSMHGAFIDLYVHSPDEKIRAVSESRVREGLDVAKQLGVQAIVFHTNSLPMIEKEQYYDNWVKTNAAFWTKMIEEFNITILIENMWDGSPNLLLKLIQEVNSSKLRVCFDVGHCNVFSKVPMSEWFEKMGKYIPYIHINDNDGMGDFEWSVGKGNIDWKEFTNLVKKHCDNPRIVIEVANLDSVKSSVEYMQSNKVYPFGGGSE